LFQSLPDLPHPIHPHLPPPVADISKLSHPPRFTLISPFPCTSTSLTLPPLLCPRSSFEFACFLPPHGGVVLAELSPPILRQVPPLPFSHLFFTSPSFPSLFYFHFIFFPVSLSNLPSVGFPFFNLSLPFSPTYCVATRDQGSTHISPLSMVFLEPFPPPFFYLQPPLPPKVYL